MYIKNQHYNNALRKVKIEFGTLIGLEEDKEAYITLRELDTMTTLQLKDVSQSGNQNEMMAFFRGILPKILVSHNLYESENTLLKNEEVADFIFQKLDLTTKVMSEYTKSMFRSKSAGAEGNIDNKQDAVPETV